MKKLLFLLLIFCNSQAMIQKSPGMYNLNKYSLFSNDGELTTITGPMYAGKTANLILYVKFAREQRIKYLAFKHTFDTRTENTLKSRAYAEEIPCISTSSAEYILLKVLQEEPEVLFIDEVQFYSNKLINVIDTMIKAKINVVVSGLDTNFRRESFGTTITQLVQRSKNKIKLQSRCNLCNCHNAEYTQRLVNGMPALSSDPDIIIDDDKSLVTYEPRCKNCHILL